MTTADTTQSRRERREQKRAEQRSQQEGVSRRRSLRRVLLWGGLAAVVALVGWLMVRAAGSTPTPTADGILAVAVAEGEHARGPADAPVTLVEYSDFQCPACAAYHPLLTALMEDPANAGKIRLIYRHFPLTRIHRNAELAARSAEAASLQGKFWEYHDLLFQNQTKWSAMSGTGAAGEFESYAGQLGLDLSRWKEDRDSDAVRDAVKADMEGGESSGVDSTPSFFVNGTRMPPPRSAEEFSTAILNAAQ